MDKIGGKSRKGREVQRVEFNRQLDGAIRPLTDLSHEDMNVLRKRIYLSARDQQ